METENIPNSFTFTDDGYLKYYQRDYEIWAVEIDKIKVVSFYHGLGVGDNFTTVIVLICSC